MLNNLKIYHISEDEVRFALPCIKRCKAEDEVYVEMLEAGLKQNSSDKSL